MSRMKAADLFYRKRWVSRLFFLLLLLAVWEASAWWGGISPLLLPKVETVAVSLATGLAEGTLLAQTLFSLGVIVLGLLISTVLALLLAVAAQLSPFVDRLTDALTVLAHPLPGMALLPLIVIWFGTGTPAVLGVIVHACLWPLLLSLQSGIRETPSIYRDLGKNFSMNPLRITLEILLPASLAQAISGLRIGWARAWRALISAEMVFGAVGDYGGLGWYLFKRRAMMDTAGLFAGLIVVALIGMAVEGLFFERLEKGTLRRWRARTGEEERW